MACFSCLGSMSWVPSVLDRMLSIGQAACLESLAQDLSKISYLGVRSEAVPLLSIGPRCLSVPVLAKEADPLEVVSTGCCTGKLLSSLHNKKNLWGDSS